MCMSVLPECVCLVIEETKRRIKSFGIGIPYGYELPCRRMFPVLNVQSEITDSEVEYEL